MLASRGSQLVTHPQYSMYLYMTMAIPIAMAANRTDVMSIIERQSANPMNERVLRDAKNMIKYESDVN